MRLSPRLQNLKPSATIAMSVKAREMVEAGIDVISLTLGEPDFETPDFIKEAAIQAIRDNYNHYTPVGGFLELKKAVCQKFLRDNGLHYTPQQIVVSTGAKQSLYNLIQCLVGDGDEVILPAPYWVSYADIVRLAGGTVVEIPTGIEQNFKITPQQLQEAITDKTRVLLFSSPNNPSGSTYTSQELTELADIIAAHPHIIAISDEIYEHIVYNDDFASLASIDKVYDQVATVNGLAKGFAMTGWRIGYIGAPQWLATACETLQGQITSGTNAIAQRAAITALQADPESVKFMKEAFTQRREIVLQLAKEVKGFKTESPSGAFYLFPDVSEIFGKTFGDYTINNANDLAMYLLEKAHVATVSGESFGSPNNLRISFASSVVQLQEAFRRIQQALEHPKP
ncbi:MAG: pyridoxal phosphate-dependent aminotransferase [Weeksellaceae bacterium]|nr:pyridoxal phosphate-dependent aminotransferase [Weeksellaceae bacterium]